MKKHIITIAGMPGSGKSTTAKAVATKLGYYHYSSGDFFRQLAKERGMELLQATIAQNADMDKAVDDRITQVGLKEDKLVIDGHIAWNFIPPSFKVFLDLDLKTAAQRVVSEANKDRLSIENVSSDPEEYTKSLEERRQALSNRFKKRYGIDIYDMSHYDLVVNTATHNLEEVTDLVIKAFTQWLQI